MKLKTNIDYAIKTSVELAKLNVQSSQQWIPPESVIDFIDKIYDSLTSKSQSEE